MVCKVRYLNSAGIMPREIPGIAALSQAFPPEWLLYVSLNCYPRNQPPMEIDAFVVLDDRVLILEIKDWNGKLTAQGDQWLINGGMRGRSSVIGITEKAKKLRTVIRSQIPPLSKVWVDGRVVLTASTTKQHLPSAEQALVWSLKEACSIANGTARMRLLRSSKLGLLKVYQFEREFDRFTGNPKLFQPSEADWGGYRIVTPDLFVHPQGVWREHAAERKGERRLKSLVRIWSFDQLPPGLNSPDRRQFIAQREITAIAHLTAQGSRLLTREQILRHLSDGGEEVLTQHFEVRSLTDGWTTLDRYLERVKDDLDWDDRVLVATTLLSIVAGLHEHGIAHRDLGLRSVWVGDPTRMAISGLMSCYIPSEETMADWLPVLRGYALDAPEDRPDRPIGTGMQRDVYLVGRLIGEILTGRADLAAEAFANHLEGPGLAFRELIERATQSVPTASFPNAVVLAEAFGDVAEGTVATPVDQAALDHFEVAEIPYVKWPQTRSLSMTGARSVYVSQLPAAEELTVKVWNGLVRGLSAESDLGMIRLLEGVARLIANPIEGLPQFIATGLSPVGPFMVYRHVAGIRLEDFDTDSTELRVRIADQLLECIAELHAIGCSHGDIAPKNILYDPTTERVCVLDTFDVTPVGRAQVKTPAYCPANWEVLGEQPLDRYAVVKIARNLLSASTDAQVMAAVEALSLELERPSIESLDPPRERVRQLLDALRAPPVPSFALMDPRGERPFRSDDGRYFLTVQKIGVAAVRYLLTSLDAQLVLSVDKGVLLDWHFSALPFHVLAAVSTSGTEVRAQITVKSGLESGFSDLLTFFRSQMPGVEEAAPVEMPEAVRRLNVPVYWNRLTELEEDARPSIEITEDRGTRAGCSLYAYQTRNQPFDFDPDATVEFYLQNGRRGGQIDINRSDANTLAIREGTRRLSVGDVVTLADRREQTSFDRRRKAIQRILNHQSAISSLLDYFSPGEGGQCIDFGIEVPDSDLEVYGLNAGQQDAFRYLSRYGPLGLLQGPPGTGKTRFIASFVHWLVTRAGARRVLIASQSHEAVNNAIEALVSLFKRQGGRPSLLRIGSKGITAKIRPYHTQTLRERYLQRFEGALKRRVSLLTSSLGIKRALASDVVDIDRTLGLGARRLDHWAELIETAKRPEEKARYAAHFKRVAQAFEEAGRSFDARALDAMKADEELESVYGALPEKHPGASPSDVRSARHTVEFARDWRDSLGSPQRNFEEFLAKTRTILTATCVGVGQTKIRIDVANFDWVIVDEAARCTPGELAVPVQLGRRVLLVGDHLQLKPMIDPELVDRLQDELPGVARAELLKSDFERAFASPYGSQYGRALNEQYRMHPAICELVSQVFYEPHGVRLHTSLDRPAGSVFDAHSGAAYRLPITWVDTSNADDSYERQRENDTTFWNPAEVRAVMKVLESLAARPELVAALAEEEEESPIGVITMYSGQKEMLERAFAQRAWEPRFRRLVRIDTVDAYQGKENALVIVSLVRANRYRTAGHVRESNRCNVAVSRARDRLVIIGAQRMWGVLDRGNSIREVLEYMSAHPQVAQTLAIEDVS